MGFLPDRVGYAMARLEPFSSDSRQSCEPWEIHRSAFRMAASRTILLPISPYV